MVDRGDALLLLQRSILDFEHIAVISKLNPSLGVLRCGCSAEYFHCGQQFYAATLIADF
jgi:hypothetical protein